MKIHISATLMLPVLPDKYFLVRYRLTHLIAEGSWAKVYCVETISEPRECYALKIIRKQQRSKPERVRNEVACHRALSDQPNVIALIAVCQVDGDVYILQELGELDLFEQMTRAYIRGMPEHVVKCVARDMIRALQSCHQKGIMHRDVKLENIVGSLRNGYKLTDFGFATQEKSAIDFVGSLDYISPEIVNLTRHDYRTDIWSLGVTIFALSCGRHPFLCSLDCDTEEQIRQGCYLWPSRISPQCQNFVAQMLQVDVEKRASLLQLSAHEWLN